MAYTVIGMFENTANANTAKQQLISGGFTDNQVDLSPFNGTADDINTSYSSYQEDEHTTGFWNWLFGDDQTTRKQYSAVATRTHVLTVHAANKEDALRATTILDNNGAIELNDYARTYNEKYTAASKTAGRKVTDTETIPVIEEELHVGKRTVETGGVKVRSRIIEKPVEEKLRLRNERVYVVRTDVNRPATEADFAAFKEGTIELTEHAERAVTEKTATVVGEVTVGKDVETKTKTISDTVRETKVDVVEDTTNRIVDKTTGKNRM